MDCEKEATILLLGTIWLEDDESFNADFIKLFHQKEKGFKHYQSTLFLHILPKETMMTSQVLKI